MSAYSYRPSLTGEFLSGGSPTSPERARALNGADDAARGNGHELGPWQPYGRANEKARCSRCGAEARVPYSSQTGGYREPVGPAVFHPCGTDRRR